jgi:hypothetical protein
MVGIDCLDVKVWRREERREKRGTIESISILA